LPSEQHGMNIIVFTENPLLIACVGKLKKKKSILVKHTNSFTTLWDLLKTNPVTVLILDTTPLTSAQIGDSLKRIQHNVPATQTILLIRDQDLTLLRTALETGNYPYAKLPVSDRELHILIETAIYRAHHLSGTEGKKSFQSIPGFVGESARIRKSYQSIIQAASQDISILLLGETGTGKDLAAHAIHQMSARKACPFIPVNLGALPTDLVASELFGHAKGAFTGATQSISGRFEQAKNGTIFLDEIDSIDEKVQVGLLRLLEHKTYHPIGSKRKIQSACRIIAASNVSFNDLLERETFRNDLLFRLDVFRIHMPALRECLEDIPILAQYFMDRYKRELNRPVEKIDRKCMDILVGYEWPGNVREFKNVIQRAVLVCSDDTLQVGHLPDRFKQIRQKKAALVEIPVGTTLDEAEKQMIQKVLELTRNNRTEAAKQLGITRRSLYNKLDKHGLK